MVSIPDLSLGWPYTQNETILNWQFINCLKKYDFFANDSKHRHSIYRWNSFFVTSIDSRLLPQNKVPFGLDLLAKFCHFARKNISMIRALSFLTEGTIRIKRPRGIDWYLRWPLKLAGGWQKMLGSHSLPTCGPPPSTAAIRPALLLLD